MYMSVSAIYYHNPCNAWKYYKSLQRKIQRPWILWNSLILTYNDGFVSNWCNLVNGLLQQIIKVDDVVLHLKVRNPIRQKCITAGQGQADPGSSSFTQCIRIHHYILLYTLGGTAIGWSMHMLGRIGCGFGNFCARMGMVSKSVCQ